MKKIWKRSFAYLVDLIILVLLVSIISNIPGLNNQLDDYNKYYKEFIELTEEYTNFTNDLNEYYEAEEQNDEDYQKLIDDYKDYEELLTKYYEDNKLEETEYNELIEEYETNYQKQYKGLYYKLEKNSTFTYIAYLIVTILYFGVFNLITDGQTLGKKITRLKIVKKDGSKPNIINYILRSILIYNSIYYIVTIISSYTLSQNDFYTVTNITYQLLYYVQWIIILMMLVRIDGRGLHDFIGNTKVVALDKEGNIIEDEPIFLVNKNITSEEVNEKEITEPKEIEKASKPNPPKKTKSKPKKKKVIDAQIEEKE